MLTLQAVHTGLIVSLEAILKPILIDIFQWQINEDKSLGDQIPLRAAKLHFFGYMKVGINM